MTDEEVDAMLGRYQNGLNRLNAAVASDHAARDVPALVASLRATRSALRQLCDLVQLNAHYLIRNVEFQEARVLVSDVSTQDWTGVPKPPLGPSPFAGSDVSTQETTDV